MKKWVLILFGFIDEADNGHMISFLTSEYYRMEAEDGE